MKTITRVLLEACLLVWTLVTRYTHLLLHLPTINTHRARPVLHFMVPSFGEEEDLVRDRHRLKGLLSSHGQRFVLMDVLSPEETILHRALYPQFLEAIRAGRRAQFSRAFLRIDGVPVVLAPAC